MYQYDSHLNENKFEPELTTDVNEEDKSTSNCINDTPSSPKTPP
jgi:hypothetical protein